MSFPRYESYRESGVEWLGQVPSHWKLTRLRYLARLNPSKSECSGLADDTEVSFVPMEALGEAAGLDLSRTRRLGEVRNGYSYFRDGDLAFAKVTPCFENGKGALMAGLLDGIGFGTTELTVMRPLDVSDGLFLHWLLFSRAFRGPAEGEMLGAGGLKRVPDEFVASFPVALPPCSERRAIIHFLDRETAKIDGLIEAQRRLIELLKEKRQAVISHAVTKGLDPTAPMKPSGVEWLGDVPAHWEVKRIKQVCRTMEQGWSPQCDGYAADWHVDWGVLKVGCVNGGVFNPNENKFLPANEIPRPELGIEAGDLLISRANTRELVGSTAVAETSFPKLLLCDKLYRLRLHPKCSPIFLGLFLRTGVARSQIELQATGASSSMLNIGQSTIRELSMPLPSRQEQEAILSDVSLAVSKIDGLAAEAQTAIDLLQERRGALISAAVTGKIDVSRLASSSAEPTTAEAA